MSLFGNCRLQRRHVSLSQSMCLSVWSSSESSPYSATNLEAKIEH